MTPKQYLNKKAFCTLPWLGMYVQPDGDVRNCAITKTTLGNINHQPLEEILLGPVNTQIKTDMTNDVFHRRCEQCHNLEKNQKFSLNGISNRVWYLKTLYDSKDLDFFDRVQNYRPKMLDLRWKNTCNFACVYCGPDLSSAWASELKKPQKISDDALSQSLEYIHKHLDSVEHVYLAGGEPLLIKENIDLLNRLYDLKPNIELRINTNLSVINNEIYRLIQKFQNVHWTVSVDNVGEQFEYVRYGGSWKTFTQNLQQLRQDFEKINFNSVWFVLNGIQIFDCIDYLLDQGFHENTIIVNPLDSPDHWHVCNLPEYHLDKIRQKIKSKLLMADTKYSLYTSLTLMLNYMETPFKKNINSAIAELAILDQRRNLDSKAVFADLYKLI
jgi:radical SAM protein with 4Fe4S-binding SPASM domain